MIEASTARLRSLSYSLGVAAETLAVEEGTKLIEDCRTAVSLRQKAEEELAEVKAFIADYEARKAEKTAVEREEKALQSSIRLLSIRLGAVLYEQCSFSLLDKDCFSAIYNDISSSTEVRKSFLSRFARKSSDDRFLSYASRVLAENLDSRMQGGAKELLEEIERMGVAIAHITLHVGLGTFRPVKVDTIEDHHMHSEFYVVEESEAEKINAAKASGGRIVCVGTTSCRTLESAADENGILKAKSGWTDIFIYPGYQFKILDCLITNFHLPESTLVMLVSALAGREHILNAYQEAIRERYRFFSFGDAMFITNDMEERE